MVVIPIVLHRVHYLPEQPWTLQQVPFLAHLVLLVPSPIPFVSPTAMGGSATTSSITGTINPVLAITPTASTNKEVNVAYSQTNVASGGDGSYTYSLASGTLPTGTTLDTATGTVSGTPSASGAFTYTIRVTDGNGGSATTSSITGTINPVLAITPTASTNKEVNVAYSQTNVASGGDGSYTYSLASGTLPTGTTLDTATGTVSGTPSASGAFTYTIRVTDGNGGSATTSSITGTINPVLAITPTASTNKEVNVAYSQTNVASGGDGSYTYSLASGTLPTGTTLDTATGTVSGTPSASGAFTYTIRVTDGNGGSATTSSITGTINPVLAITPTASTNKEVNVAYSQTNVASGGDGSYTYSLASGTLPTGTTLDTATGTVSGTPSASGAFTYTIRVTDGNGGSATTSSITGTINPVLAITPTASTNKEVNVAYSQTNVASGGDGSYTYSLASGTLPTGTTLDTATGTVSGTPSASGAFTYTIRVTDGNGGSATTSSITGTINPVLAITPTASTNKEVNVAYSQTNVASGGDGSYTYSLASGTLPTGTTLDTATGTVSGTPSASGAFTYTIRVTDGNGGSATTSSITGTINPVLAITPTASTNTQVNVTYSQTNAASGGDGNYTYTVASGAVPSGTSLNPLTGTVYGTPDTAAAFSYTINVTDTNGGSATTSTISGTIAALKAPSPNDNSVAFTIDSNLWSSVAISPTLLTSISCPSKTFCMAVDTEGTAFQYDGTQWNEAENIDAGRTLKSVSCANPSYCLAVDSSGYAFVYSGSWDSGIQFDMDGEPSSVSCPSASFCMVTDNNGHSFTYDGTHWSDAELVNITSDLTAVSCSSEHECMAVDAEGNTSYYNGSNWVADSANPISRYHFKSVSCAPNSGSFCLAVDDAGNAFHYNGSSWSTPYGAIDSEPLNSVSCLGNAFCMATDNSGGALLYNGMKWSGVSDIDELHAITSLSCPTSEFCMGVDNAGNAWQYHAKVSNVVQAYAKQDENAEESSLTQTISLSSGKNTTSKYQVTGLNHPENVYIDTRNNLWIADKVDAKVYRLPASTRAGLTDHIPALVSIANANSTQPTAVTTDTNGNIYVADHENAIYIYSGEIYQIPGKYADAKPSRVITGKKTALNAPSALALDPEQNIWVANKDDNSIVQFSAGASTENSDTQPTATISGPRTQLDEPNSLFVDGKGNVWVTNAKTNEIYVFAKGTVGNTAPSCIISSDSIDTPTGITLDADGNIYQSNDISSGGAIHVFEPVSATCGAVTLSPMKTIASISDELSKTVGLSIGYVF